jgi:hypothetical protein
MAAMSDFEVNVGVNIEPFEWMVTAAMDHHSIAEWLNKFSGEGWDVFTILTNGNGNFILVLRRQIKKEDD